MHSVRQGTPSHIAWLLPMGTLFFACGILVGRGLSAWWPMLLVGALGIGASLCAQGWRRAFAWGVIALGLGGVLGWHGYHPALPAEGDYAVRGTITQEIALAEDGQVQTVLTGVTLNGKRASDAYWTFYLGEDEALPAWLQPGVSVAMTAKVYHPNGRMNPGGFNFKEYLLQRGIDIGLYGAEELVPTEAAFSLRGWLASVRHDLSLRLMAVMGEEAGSYAAAMLLGTRDFLPEDDRAAFNELGIAHILSVSGYHVSVLAGMLLLLLRPLPIGRKGRFGVEALVLLAYCLLTGGNAPVIRAAGLLLWRAFSRLRNRQILPLHLLCATALAQLLFNPTLLTSASFQLTYGAMLGLTLVYPWLKTRVSCRSRISQRLWEAFAASLAAQLGILLPQLYWFGELPLFAILLNMAVLALAGTLMALYWVTLAALPIPGLRMLLGRASSIATALMLRAVRMLAAQDFTALWIRQPDAFTLSGWALLIWGLSSLVPRSIARHRPKILLLGAVLTALLLVPLPQTDTSYTQFSVGNADAAVLQDKDVTVVIDTGEDGQALASYLHQRRQTVETLIITHLHIDHAGGIEALLAEGVPVEVCYLPADAEIPVIDEEVLPLIDALRMTGTEFRFLHRGDVIELPSGRLTALWPEAGRVSALHDANDVCLVLQADIAGVTMLLASDLPGVYEKYISVPADVLKVAHHGSADSTTPEFLAAVDPQILLLSNRLKSREIRMVEAAGEIPLYTTEKHGGITIRFLGDGAYTVDTVTK